MKSTKNEGYRNKDTYIVSRTEFHIQGHKCFQAPILKAHKITTIILLMNYLAHKITIEQHI